MLGGIIYSGQNTCVHAHTCTHTHTHTHTHTLDIREVHSVRDDTSGVGSMELKSFMEE